MACSIKILSAAGTQHTGALVSIAITGTETDCDKVRVDVSCGGGNSIQQTVQSIGGAWTAIFKAADIKTADCFCNKPIQVTATCADPSTTGCSDTVSFNALLCTALWCEATVSATVDTVCDHGKRKVTLSIQNAHPIAFSAWLNFGDGSPVATITVPPLGTLNVAHSYAPGSYTATLEIPGCLNPDGTQAKKSVTFTVGPCCPEIVLNAQAAGACNTDGTQTYTITATVTPANPGTITANLVEGTSLLASGSNPFPSAALNLTYSGSFPSGTHKVCLNILAQPDMTYPDVSCTTFVVNCVGACCLPSDCKDGMTRDQCQSAGGQYMGDGTTCSTVTCPVPPPPPECLTQPKSWLCPLLLVLMTFATAFGLALYLMSTCAALYAISNFLYYLGLVLTAIGVAALLLYWILCAKCLCGWFYLFLWRVLFGVGLLIALFAGCCSNLLWPGIIMMVLGLLALYGWFSHCKKTICELLSEVLTVWAVYLVPVVAAILGSKLMYSCLLVLFTIGTFNVTLWLLATIVFAIVWSLFKKFKC